MHMYMYTHTDIFTHRYGGQGERERINFLLPNASQREVTNLFQFEKPRIRTDRNEESYKNFQTLRVLISHSS